jgi:hypothetical protein
MPALLRPYRGSATKTIGPNGVVRDYAAGVAFVGRNIAIPFDVTAQAEWLRDQVRRDEFYIGGDIRDGAADMRTLINRRYLALAGRGPPDIRDALQTHLFMDCDGALGSCGFREDPVAAAASVRDMAPELKGVACGFAGSSQAGQSERVRGKYLFRLAAPKSRVELRAWAQDVNRRIGQKLADPALYNPVQPVYLAAPRFVGGASDPMPERVLVLPGDERPIVLPVPASHEREVSASTYERGRVDGQASQRETFAQSALFNGFDLSENEDLTAGLFNFAEYKDAVEHLTGRGWFDKGEHDHMLRLAFSCADITVKGAADADAVRELYFRVVDKTGRNQADNEARYDDALRRMQGLNGGGKIVTPGTIFHWAHEQGWTGLAAALSPAASSSSAALGWTAAHEAAALKVAKSRLHNAFQTAEFIGRHRILGDLTRVCMAVRSVSVRSRLMFTLAALLTKSKHSPEEIVNAVVVCGFPRETGVHAFVWARKNIAKREFA